MNQLLVTLFKVVGILSCCYILFAVFCFCLVLICSVCFYNDASMCNTRMCNNHYKIHQSTFLG